MNINIQFNPDGTAHCLWTDAISLHDLGRLQITRASNIEFNNADQKWEVIDKKGRVSSFPNRDPHAWDGNTKTYD